MLRSGSRRSLLSEFQTVGPTTANARRLYMLSCIHGTTSRQRLGKLELRCRRSQCWATGVRSSDRKSGETLVTLMQMMMADSQACQSFEKKATGCLWTQEQMHTNKWKRWRDVRSTDVLRNKTAVILWQNQARSIRTMSRHSTNTVQQPISIKQQWQKWLLVWWENLLFYFCAYDFLSHCLLESSLMRYYIFHACKLVRVIPVLHF